MHNTSSFSPVLSRLIRPLFGLFKRSASPTLALPRGFRALGRWAVAPLWVMVVAGAVQAGDTTPAQQLSYWSAQAGKPGQVAQGQAFFNSKHGGEWSCASCHGAPPTTSGKHANTGKTIAPLAPAFNPKAFTDTAKVEKWFRRNCNDVLSRECSATEKADVLAYLNSLKP